MSAVVVTMEYQRDGVEMTSSGRFTSSENGRVTEEGAFSQKAWREILKQLAHVLERWSAEQAVDIFLARTDRAGLLSYRLDDETVKLLRTDPISAFKALEYTTSSPSAVVQHVQRDRVPRVQPPVKAGHDALADAFGDVVYFKVRGHELECPGCGYWGMYTTPGLLNHLDRAGEVIKTTFMCQKKCCSRFSLTCDKTWGYVEVKYLLEQTKLDAFFFPRAWNEGRPWVSRESLQKLYSEYKADKEKVTCSAT